MNETCTQITPESDLPILQKNRKACRKTFIKVRIAFLALNLTSAGLASATTIAWTNTSGGNWSVAANWDPNQVPGDGDTALITSNGIYTVALDRPITIASLTLGGTSGQQTLTNNVNNLALTNASTVNTNGALAWYGGNLNGPGLLTVLGRFDWIGGVLDTAARVSIVANGVLNLTGGSDKTIYGGVLTNAGTATWTGTGNIAMNNFGNANNGLLVNLAGGTFDVQNDQHITGAWGSESLNNAGLFRKSASTGTNSIGVLFNSTGTVDIQSGVVQVNNGGTNSGTFNAGAGATIWLYGNYTFDPGSQITGAGTHLWSAGTIAVNTTVAAQDVELAGSQLSGTNAFTGTLNWTAGGLASADQTTIAANAVLNISGILDRNVYGPLTNAGTINWMGGRLFVYNDNGANFNGSINNLVGGTIDLQNDLNNQSIPCACYGHEFFNNAGLFRKSGGTGTTTIGVPFNNTGTVDAQSGTMSFEGFGVSYTQPGGTLNFGISSLTAFGRVNIAGNAPLTGTFSANLNGGYVPPTGSSFTNLTFGSSTGQFGDANLPFAAAWQTNYADTSFSITVLNVRPTITAIPDKTVLETTPLAFTVSAADLDGGQTLTYNLINPPSGATINTDNGNFNWTPAEAEGPSADLITVTVTDNGSPSLTATNTFTVTVLESNLPPTLTLPANQTIHAGTLVSLNATATDPDLPPNPLTFSLVSGPAGLTVSASGAITWATGDGQANTTNDVTVRVCDTNPPAINEKSLCDTKSFTLTVQPRPLITSITPEGTNVQLTWTAIAGASYRVLFNTNVTAVTNALVGDVTTTSNTATTLDTTLAGATRRFYRVQVLP